MPYKKRKMLISHEDSSKQVNRIHSAQTEITFISNIDLKSYDTEWENLSPSSDGINPIREESSELPESQNPLPNGQCG